MPRAIVGYHMGVLEDSKGWLFWVPEKNVIMKLASASFDESKFYKDEITGNTVSSIQVQDIFDSYMIDELVWQDEVMTNIFNQNGLQLSIPSTYREAIFFPNKVDWIRAINEERESMKTEKVFSPVDLNNALKEVPHEIIHGTKCVFTKKPERFKARLVARGFCKIHGINYDETFAPTPTFNSLHLVFSTACFKKWELRTFDVKVSFLHSLIDKPVYVWPPMGMNVLKHKVLKLDKALYGTKQASRCWWLHLKGILKQIGFTSNAEDPSTYTLNKGNEQAILWIHVDDRALTVSSNELM
ncbi:hypothetical protein O181_018105 [Austropuccinia psidii MF-1]|uniref:Reverse transcriptase Ty1/copia-type domain-containing protein n=1 Tax=Austropuccinia psidii MF-1 TaxID=1389203 RepID=A0A9Q3GTP6_9BASI|nr:hypothetical protein [Austropuccinia psidii MF-1]